MLYEVCGGNVPDEPLFLKKVDGMIELIKESLPRPSVSYSWMTPCGKVDKGKTVVSEMKHIVLFTGLDGFTDEATLVTRGSKGCYATTIKIGLVSRQVNSGMINQTDSYHAAVQTLAFHRDNAVIKQEGQHD